MKKVFSNTRLKRVWVLAAALGVIIALRMADIQLLRSGYYKDMAERNRTQAIFQAAPRGNIFTSDGQIIAGSQPAFDLYFIPGSETYATGEEEINNLAAALAPLLKEDKAALTAKIKKAAKSGHAAAISENISVQNVLPIAEIHNYYHGIYLNEEAKRFYPHGILASHLVGFLGNMEGAAWRERDMTLDYRLDSKIGRYGMEKHFERELKGSDGGLYLEVDFRGRVKRIIEDKKFVPGSDIYTTINFNLQRAAEEGLKNSITGRGAAVALDPRNGAVRAIVSAPGFDPNIFVPFNDENTGEQLKRVKEYNLAVQGSYAPASTFKIITSLAAMAENKLNVKDTVYCPGFYDSGPRVFKCWAVHGNENYFDAMADSCDVYFYALANRIGAAAIERAERAFMFAEPTGIDIPGERRGNIFGPARRAQRKTYWFVGDTLNLSIGQGELLLTPVKMAQIMAAVASKGTLWKPYYIEKILAPDGTAAAPYAPQITGTAQFKPEHWDILHKALKGVVEGGTGRVARVDGVEVYGKTGTAQNPHGDDHGWYVGFAARPGQEAELAFAVFVENGRGGASAAGPIVKNMIEAYFGVNNEH